MNAAGSSETLWAEHGLTGLVLSALFGLILLFLKSSSKKDQSHQEFVQKMIEDERKERSIVRQENSANSNKLSSAIDSLAQEIRRSNLP